MTRSDTKAKARRRTFTAAQKAEILRRHLADKVPVSDLCDQYSIQPSLFYLWQRQLLENLEAALQDGRTQRTEREAAAREKERTAALEAALARKDAVIAEVSEQYLSLKKELGGL
jgi:transposase